MQVHYQLFSAVNNCIQSVDPDDSETYLFRKNHRSPAIRLWKPSPQNHSCD